ncbi:MAG: SGNH/GDSL hydrolase family protein [Pseudomonadota bacterium]
MVTANAPASAQGFVSPDILVIGDSQLSFGSGKQMLAFFERFATGCAAHVEDKKLRQRIERMKTQMLGVRSSSLQSWTSRKGAAWRALCRKDKTWGVNTSVWGHNATPGVLYHQIGEGRRFNFCRAGRTPLQNMLREDYYTPELVFFYLLGNGAGRVARNPKAAGEDVSRLVAQLPPTTKCIFMSTAPIHTPRRNRTRAAAQRNLAAAFEGTGQRCRFLPALTPEAIAAIQGKTKYFPRRKDGRLKDPFHPDKRATKKFLSIVKPKMCRMLADTLAMPRMAGSADAGSP